MERRDHVFGLKTIDDFAELLVVDGWIDGAVVHFQTVSERLQQ